MILYMVLGNATMTKYRIVSDGYAEHLQYLRERKFLFFFSVRYWCYIWRPYYDRIWGRGMDSYGYKTYISSHNTDFESFTSKYKCISEYFKWASKEQKRLESRAKKETEEINKRKSEVTYL